MKKFATLLSLLCIMHMFAFAGLIGYLVATGRLDKPKFRAITAMLRHPGEPQKFDEKLYDILEPTPATSTAPATQAATTDPFAGNLVAASAEERITLARQAMEQERLRLLNEAQDLRHRQELLVQLQADVDAKLKKIQDAQKGFDAQVAAAKNKSQTTAFQKTLDLYNQLKAKQVKDLFINMPPDIVASYLQAMHPDRAGEVISQFKSPPETAFIGGVLERIRSAGTSAASASPAAAGNAPPASPGT